MTRKQAQKIADQLKQRAEYAGKGDLRWTSQLIKISPDEHRALQEDRSLITGCLPMGWFISAVDISEIIIRRRLS